MPSSSSQCHSGLAAWTLGLQRRGVLAVGPIFPPWSTSSRSWSPSWAASLRSSRSRASGITFPRGSRRGLPARSARPLQPQASRRRLGLDCRYCHASVEISAVANVPPTQTCMNCHTLVKRDSVKLAPIRESASSGRPMHWIRVHELPDYAYFTHRSHVAARNRLRHVPRPHRRDGNRSRRCSRSAWAGASNATAIPVPTGARFRRSPT